MLNVYAYHLYTCDFGLKTPKNREKQLKQYSVPETSSSMRIIIDDSLYQTTEQA